MTKLDHVRNNLLQAYVQRDEAQAVVAKANETIAQCRLLLAGSELVEKGGLGAPAQEVSE